MNDAVTTAPLDALAGRWHGALCRYLAVVGLGNLAWEFAHMPLYTIWTTGTRAEIVFAAIHCTGGDMLIGLSSLILALLFIGNGAWPAARFWAVATLTIALGLAYTVFSEWLNIIVRTSWSYSELMPTVPFFGFEVGLSPLVQWIAVPAAGFLLARRSRRSPATPASESRQ